MARRAKMRVEIFSIGFGKPIYSWEKNGVKWQICFLPFGGYVKIAGMEKNENDERSNTDDGFYEKSPIDRIKVAVMGPAVNIVFAFLIFTGIWIMGGRTKSFSEFTKTIGWVDPDSKLANFNVRAGDTISNYNNKHFNGFKDLLYNGVMNDQSIDIEGNNIDYINGTKSLYKHNLEPYHMPGMVRGIQTIGVISPASFLIFDGFNLKSNDKLPAISSGIEKGDRILWANGEFIFSLSQLNYIVNQNYAFMTVDRDGEQIQVKTARVLIGDLRIGDDIKDELSDWKWMLGIKSGIEDLYFIPYEVNELGYVVNKIAFIDDDMTEKSNALYGNLQNGDKILSIYGEKIDGGLSLLDKLREKKVLLVTQKTKQDESILWQNQDDYFEKSVNWSALQQVVSSIGTINFTKDTEGFKILNPITPITVEKFNKIVEEPLLVGDKNLKKEFLFLGASIRDNQVIYNPNPFLIFKDVVCETYNTIASLISGNLSPKWLSGPVGIVKVMHDGWSTGIKEALYWIGLISLNLGLMNLLPIPVLDGGLIGFSLFELVTKKKISQKIMAKIVFPFIVLLITFFVYVTYQDIVRLFL